MQAKNCCGCDPDIELNYDLDECSIKCRICDRSIVRRKLEDCIREWNADRWECKFSPGD